MRGVCERNILFSKRPEAELQVFGSLGRDHLFDSAVLIEHDEQVIAFDGKAREIHYDQ